MKKFKEYTGLNLSQVNKDMLERWKSENLFASSVALRQGAPSFVFYEGPPSANGMPGIHHVMARTIKDLFCRYKTMQGFQVKRKAGWDTHGLPVELGVERSLGITKEDIGKKISVEEYNAACRREVMKYTREWESLTEMMGYWVDTTDPYITYDNRYIETVWWLLAQLHSMASLGILASYRLPAATPILLHIAWPQQFSVVMEEEPKMTSLWYLSYFQSQYSVAYTAIFLLILLLV